MKKTLVLLVILSLTAGCTTKTDKLNSKSMEANEAKQVAPVTKMPVLDAAWLSHAEHNSQTLELLPQIYHIKEPVDLKQVYDVFSKIYTENDVKSSIGIIGIE
jgi:hypothetical protein